MICKEKQDWKEKVVPQVSITFFCGALHDHSSTAGKEDGAVFGQN